MHIVGCQTRKKIYGQMTSSPDCSNNPILPYCISIVFRFSCSLILELFSKENSLLVFKLLINFLNNLKKVVKRDIIAYLHFLNNEVLQLVKLIVKSKTVEVTFFAAPNRALIF